MKARKKVIIELVRPYRTLVLAGLLFLAAGAWALHRAETNDRGLLIDGIIHLDPGGADVFYGVVGIFSLGMGGAGVYSAVCLRLRKEFRLVLGVRSVSFPHGAILRMETAKIPYDDVLSVATLPAQSPSLVRVDTRDGAWFLSGRYLPGDWPVAAVAKEIVDRWRAHVEKASSADVD